MKPILDLTKAIGLPHYFAEQFKRLGEDKNILFVNPQLSGKSLYKMILPFFSMLSSNVATAISGLSRYDYEGQLLGGDEIFLEEEMIEWADFIVFPFTTQPLVSEFYDKIRSVTGDTKIVFLVDFNFYELSVNHPYKRIFDEPIALSAVEDNIWFADICLTSNVILVDYLHKKAQELFETKYSDIPSFLKFACMPFMIDTDIVLKNIVEYDPLKPILVNPNEHDSETKSRIDEVAEIAEELKEINLAEKQSAKLQEDKKSEEKEQKTPEPKAEIVKEKNTKKENGSSKKQLKSEPRKGSAIAKPTAKPKSTTSKSVSKPTAKSAKPKHGAKKRK